MEGTVDCLHQAVQKDTSPKLHCIRRVADDRRLFFPAHEFTSSCQEFAVISGYAET